MAAVPLDDLPSELRGQAVPEDDLPGAKPKRGERTWGQAFGDIGASAIGGIGSLVQLPGQLAQLAGATGPSTTIEAGEQLQQFAQSLKSPELVAREQERKRKVEEAAKTGQLSAFGTAFGETVKDPALLLSFLAEQAPQLLVPFAAGRAGVAGARALGAGAQAAGRAGVGAAVGAGAVQQGADVGADAYVDIAKELQAKGATEQEAAEGALRLARQAGASASVISLLTQMLPGARIAERVLAGVPARAPGVGRLATAGKAALGETISEVPEEVGGRMAANIAMQQVKPEQDIMAGTGEAAAMAAIGATGLGGAVGAMGRPQPPATPAQPPAPEVTPPVPEAGPTPIQQRIDETTGVAAAPAPFEPLSTAEVREQKLQTAQARAEEDMAAQEERARREGPRPQVPQPQLVDKGRLYEQMPEATPRAELEAKQAEIDKLRLEAGLPTSKGVMPEAKAPEFPTEPKIVDNRPLEERAAKNRLMVMQNMLKNEGGDPNSLSIVPHPTAKDRFAIQSLDRPVRLQKDLPATAITRPVTPVVIDPIDAYIEIARRTNTPAAQRLVKDFEAGIVTREDIGLAVEAERRAGQPLPLNYKGNGEPWFIAPEERKPRGERQLPPGAKLTREPPEGPQRPFEGPQPPPETPPEPPGEEPPPPTGEMPKTLEEFKQRMPIDADQPDVRTANEQGRFKDLAEAMAKSQNPVVRRVGQLAMPVADKIMLKKPVAPGKLGGGAVGIYRYADDSIQMDTRYAGSEWVNAHETVHALVARAQRSPSPKQAPYVRQIEDLYKYTKKELGRRGHNARNTYGLTNEREFVSEAMSNPDFQYLLMQVPYKGRKSAWTEFVRIVANLLGISNTSALTEVLNLVDKLAQVKRPIRTPFDRKAVEYAGFEGVTPQQREANFKRWFGDSKVVDEDGKPLVVYHGSRSDIKRFDGKYQPFEGINIQSVDNNNIEAFVITEGETAKASVGDAVLVNTKSGEKKWIVTLHGELPYFSKFKTKEEVAAEMRRKINPRTWVTDRAAALQGASFFSEDPSYTEVYSTRRRTIEDQRPDDIGPVSYPVYLSIKNPVNPETSFEDFRPFYERAIRDNPNLIPISEIEKLFRLGHWSVKEGIPGFVAEAKRLGYDGFVNYEGITTALQTFKDLVPENLKKVWVAFEPNQIKSAIGNRGTFGPEPDIEKLELPFGKKKEEPTPTGTGQQAMQIVAATGMTAKPPEPTATQKAKTALLAAKDDPKLAAKTAKSALTNFTDKVETWAFSGDAKFNNDIRRGVIADLNENPEVMGMLLEASQSQAVHSDALATQFIVEGGIAYDEDTKKWVAVKKDDNFIKLAQKIEALAKKHGLSKENAERVAHTYFVAKRFRSLAEKQDQRDAEIASLEAEAKREQDPVRKKGLRSEIEKLQKAEVYITDQQRALIEPGLSLAKLMPELENISDTWQAIRVNAIKALVDSGMWSLEYAEAMFDNIDYVPFYREEQLEEGGGPQEFIKGLQVKAKEHRLKGSESPVNDVFDNMVRWTQYAINRSVRNHKALQMIDLGKEIKVGDEKMVTQVEKKEKGANVVRVFRDGVQELYEVADPMYMEAFSSISNVAIPSLRFFSWMANMLRQSVVLYPLFSVAQVPQDAFAAMFTSGLKPQYALRIPALAVKEFVKTLRKTSATHNMLKKYGAVGVRDFSAAVARQDVEIAAGLKAPKGVTGKVIESLSHIAMSADNAVRQAVYEASMAQGLSKAEAIEKAFDLINFRRRGTSKFINLMGQTVPFFYAYMSVQRTALKTLTGVGISPTTRGEALKTLGYTTAAVMALSLMYTMANAGDDEYEKTPTAIRDRTLHIPGTSVRIPLRPDFFLLPKIVTEHMYHLITDNGLTDGAKFRKTMRDTVWNAVASPQPIPQAAKPILEAAINYDFFQGRPIVGPFEKKKEAERQFNDNTSELSKILGSAGGVSPMVLDHVIRGMFGSVGGLVLYATNMAISPVGDVPRPDKNFQDALASIPGTSGFVTKTTESRLKNDFYELRDEVVKANETYKDIKKLSPQELEAFISDEKNMIRLGLVSTVEEVTRQLSNIRKAIGQATNAPADVMSAADKKDYIEQLREMEKQLMQGIDVPGLRKMAQM